MRKSATLGAPRAAVISLASYRAARTPSPEPESCNPLDVLQTMVDCYSVALATKVDAVRLAVGTSETCLRALELLALAPGGMVNDAVLVKTLSRTGYSVGLLHLRAALIRLADRGLISLSQQRSPWVATLKGVSQ